MIDKNSPQFSCKCFYSNLYCALKPPVRLLYLFYCLGQWLDFNGVEHKWNSREEKVAILSGRLKICTVYCSFVCFLFVSFLPLLVVFVSCLCLLVATLPMAGWADPLDCRWWKTIKTWPIHWEQSFAYPGIYKHFKQIFVCLLCLLDMSCVELVGILALVCCKVPYMRLKSCCSICDRRISAVKFQLILQNFTPLPCCYMVAYFHT